MKKLVVIILVSSFFSSVCHSQQWIKAESLHKKFITEAVYDSALYYAEESAAIMRGIVGENSLLYCNALRYLSYSQFYIGNYKKSKYFILIEAGLLESLKKTQA
jgi:hypothetical protein